MEYLGLNIRKIAQAWLRAYCTDFKYFVRHALPLREAFRRTRATRGIHAGREAFVFSTGPSLNKLDPMKIARLQKERGMHVIAINMYVNSEFGKVVEPDYYVMSDPSHWEGRMPQEEYAHLSDGERETRNAEFSESCKMAWKTLRANGAVKLFVPAHLYRRTEHPAVFPFCEAGNFFGTNVDNLHWPLGYVSMTAYKALSLACHLGYRKIYIAGFDNSFFKSVEVDAQNEIFYRYGNAVTGTQSFRAVAGWLGGKNVGEILYNQHFGFIDIEKFRRFPIENLDLEGLINCFPKLNTLDVYR